jgi:hypothetical protein
MLANGRTFVVNRTDEAPIEAQIGRLEAEASPPDRSPRRQDAPLLSACSPTAAATPSISIGALAARGAADAAEGLEAVRLAAPRVAS